MNNDELIERLQRIESMLERMHSEPTKPFLKTKDACNFLSVSPNTLIKICAANGIKPLEIKGSGLNYYKAGDLISLFNED
jgi:hypothetical protein